MKITLFAELQSSTTSMQEIPVKDGDVLNLRHAG
jgi:hypothetical protein